MTWNAAIWFVGIWWLLVAFVAIMMWVRKGSRGVKGDASPGGGVELFVEADELRRFPYLDDTRPRD